MVVTSETLDVGDRGVGWTTPLHGVSGFVRRALVRAAIDAPVRVFPIVGFNPPGLVDALRLRRDVRIVDAPASATVLLVAGDLPDALHEAAMRMHDALAHPRCTIWWTRETRRDAAPFACPTIVAADRSASNAEVVDALAAELRRAHAMLLRGERQSERALLPDVDPAPWRGVGPYGQGGAGMTGGVPYGRPMAGRAPDRDGLELDQLPVRIGPFFPPFPTGLVLDVKLQGDIVQDAVVPGNAFATAAVRATDESDIFHAALTHPVRIAKLERARAVHHLVWFASALRLHGLGALGRRTLTLAGSVQDGTELEVAGQVTALARLLERTRTLGGATAGVGVTARETVSGRGLGPVARAAGVPEDARSDDPAYRALDFTPIVQSDAAGLGDARARWRQRIAETAQSLELARRAGDRCTGGAGGSAIERPRGPISASASAETPTGVLLSVLPVLLAGLEWGDAVTTIVSLDLDLRESAVGATPLTPTLVVEPSGGMGDMSGMEMKGNA